MATWLMVWNIRIHLSTYHLGQKWRFSLIFHIVSGMVVLVIHPIDMMIYYIWLVVTGTCGYGSKFEAYGTTNGSICLVLTIWLLEYLILTHTPMCFHILRIINFQKYIGNDHPNWRTHIFQRGGPTTNQKPSMAAKGYQPEMSTCV